MKNQSKSMFSRLWLLLVCVTLQSTLPNGASETENFGYIIGSDKEPSKWGDLKPEWITCKTGKMQSPVDLPIPGDPPSASIGQLARNYNPADAIVTREHEVMFAWKGGEAGSILLDGSETYNLANFHWHSPSEHTINGKKFDVELHMVHKTADGTKITVLSHLYELGAPDPFLTLMTSNITQPAQTDQSDKKDTSVLTHVVQHETKPGESVNVDPKLIVTNGDVYFRLNGSLTVPPCLENVNWIIDQTPTPVSAEQIKMIKDAAKTGEEGNARPVQPLENRTILHGSLA